MRWARCSVGSTERWKIQLETIRLPSSPGGFSASEVGPSSQGPPCQSGLGLFDEARESYCKAIALSESGVQETDAPELLAELETF